MPKAPDGTIMDESSSDEEISLPLVVQLVVWKKKVKDGDPNPNPAGGAGACPCKECRPRSPGPIDELIAALHEATLGPACPRHHGLDPLPDEIEEGLKSKSNPQFLKDYQVKGLMRTC